LKSSHICSVTYSRIEEKDVCVMAFLGFTI
jgi:hypothetical protein